MTEPRPLSATLQQMGLVLHADDLAGLPDAELVGRFAERRDEAAFTAIVRRYGPIVFGVCRRVLRHEQDAEDAFQAAFLVFARRAAAVQRAGAVGNWLYGVAHNVARRAKTARLRRENTERAAATERRLEIEPATPDDLRDILDAELGALPTKYRAAVILCDLMGLTTREAADRIGCPAKTLGTRLGRGRALLARRLTRRGVAVVAAAVPALLAPSAMAAVPPKLIATTVHAASGFAAGSAASVPLAVAALTRGVSNAMFLKTLKVVAVLACGFAVLVGLVHGPLGPVLFASRGTANQTGGTPTAPGAARQARPTNLHDHLHHFFVHVLAQIGIAHSGAQAVDDKKDDAPAPAGTWTRKEGEVKLDFPEKDVLKIYPHGSDAIVVVCKYKVEKEGVVVATITGFEGKPEAREKAKEHLPIDSEFRFKWTVKDDAATLGDVKGEKVEKIDHIKSILEGEYGKKK